MKKEKSGWAHLPTDLLKMIADNLPNLADNSCFATVCTSWRCVAKSINIPPQVPWLVLPCNHNQEKHHLEFFCLIDNKRIYRPPIGKHNFCLGLNRGCWMLVIANEPDVFLLNPITGTKIELPSLHAIPNVHHFDALISRAALSSDPSESSDWVLMVFFATAQKFAICRGRDQAWTAVPGSWEGFRSMAYFNGKFYAVMSHRHLLICDTSSSPPHVSSAHWRFLCPASHRLYLVESASNLLLVTREIVKCGNAGEDDSFSMFMLHINEGEGDSVNMFMLHTGGPKLEWSKIDSIGDRVLFLSNNHSLLLPVSECPGSRPNCIYYGDPLYKSEHMNVIEADHNIGAYMITTDRVEMIPCLLKNSGDWGLASWVRHIP